MKASCIVLILALCCAGAASALTIMSYNVENLFDDVRDGTEYREFDPDRGKWNGDAFQQRIKALSEVLRKSIAGGPDILLLQEVENGHALQVLLKEGARGMGYTWYALVPKDGLAANVAIASRLPITKIRTHAVGPWKGAKKRGFPVRDILEAQVQVSGHALYLFNNHWKAKTEGTEVTEASRRESASVLARRIAEILAADPAADIVAAGDMNENVDEFTRAGRRYVTALMPAREVTAAAAVIAIADAPPPFKEPAAGCILFDPWLEMRKDARGSYAWHGEWLTVDHMLLSAGLFDRQGLTYRRWSFQPLKLPFLLDKKGLPRRWNNRDGKNGFSDHLPILLSLEIAN